MVSPWGIPGIPALPGSGEWGSVNLSGSVVMAGDIVPVAAMDPVLPRVRRRDRSGALKGGASAGDQATPMTYQLRKNGKQFLPLRC